MIITKNILNEKVPIEMMPTRLDSAMNLYTNVNFHGKDGIVLYNINPSTWNCLYSFYELNHKFTVDNYVFSKENIKRRLLDLGLCENTKITPIFKSFFGDPTAYSVRGTLIAIREDDSKNIFVKLS